MVKIVDNEKVQEDYKKLAADYDKHWQVFSDMPHHWVVGHMEEPRHAIDLGCGTGKLLAMIKARFPAAKVTGVDCCADMLEIAGEHLEFAEFYVGDIETMEIPDGPYDAVLSINVLHHLNDPEGHIELLHSLCSDRGAVFLCDFAVETWKLRVMDLYWRYFKPSYHQAFSHNHLKFMLEAKFDFEQDSVLKIDEFWRLQIYKLKKKKEPPPHA